MTAAPNLGSSWRDLYSAGMAGIRARFDATADGRAAVAARTALVSDLVTGVSKHLGLPGEAPGFALLAIGGFGRGSLFPCSDIDLLFLHRNGGGEQRLRDAIRNFSQELWDLRLKLSPATRTLAECGRLDSDNIELTISLLDSRYLAGDRVLFDELRQKVLVELIQRESQTLVQRLMEITRERHARFGNTVFHLESNIKDAPGGLRDYNVAGWLALISAVEKQRQWPDPGQRLPAVQAAQLVSALEFLSSVRCFLHFREQRDDNTLSWEAQDEAASRRIGCPADAPPTTADWMRRYFRHARAVHRVTLQLLEEIPAAHSSLYRQFQSWRSRLSNADFSVVNGLVLLREPSALENPDLLLRVFEFIARHGLKLSSATEDRVQEVLPAVAAHPPAGAAVWPHLRDILVQPHAGDALRAMHSLGLLSILVPEMALIDALVIRDFYHRFTVDEHSILAIENLHRLRESPSEWDKRYASLLDELEQPELLFLSLLLHDTGKGIPGKNHVQASAELTESALRRLGLSEPVCETVRFLVGSHLEMSAARRRDIFDPGTVAGFAEKVGTPERLKMLTLMTLTDIRSVSPEALTPWKAEGIWQLYIAATNQLNRSLDQRLHPAAGDEKVARLAAHAAVGRKKLAKFLDGLPRRYLQLYSADEILEHLKLADLVGENPVQLRMKRGRHWYELTAITRDRPFLFASLAGVLAAWGMNIVKADAFSNQAGIVVDTFYFTDRFRTLDLNLPEWERLQDSVRAVLLSEADLERMLRDRARSEKNHSGRVKVDTSIVFDNDCPGTSTLAQVIAQDRLGLLHRISSCFSREDCNIEIALVDTEGQMAIDVFYLTSGGAKLTAARQEKLRRTLLEELSA